MDDKTPDPHSEARATPLYSFVLGYDGENSDEDVMDSSDYDFSSDDECPTFVSESNLTSQLPPSVELPVTVPNAKELVSRVTVADPYTSHYNHTDTAITTSKTLDSLFSPLGSSSCCPGSDAHRSVSGEQNCDISTHNVRHISRPMDRSDEKSGEVFTKQPSNRHTQSLSARMALANRRRTPIASCPTVDSCKDSGIRPLLVLEKCNDAQAVFTASDNSNSSGGGNNSKQIGEESYDAYHQADFQIPNSLEQQHLSSAHGEDTVVKNYSPMTATDMDCLRQKMTYKGASQSCSSTGSSRVTNESTIKGNNDISESQIDLTHQVDDKNHISKGKPLSLSTLMEKQCLGEKMSLSESERTTNQTTSGIICRGTLIDTTTSVFSCQRPVSVAVANQPLNLASQTSCVLKDQMIHRVVNKLKDTCKDMTQLRLGTCKSFPKTGDNVKGFSESILPIQNKQPKSSIQPEVRSKIAMGIKSKEYSRPAHLSHCKSDFSFSNKEYVSGYPIAATSPRRRSSIHINTPGTSDCNFIGDKSKPRRASNISQHNLSFGYHSSVNVNHALDSSLLRNCQSDQMKHIDVQNNLTPTNRMGLPTSPTATPAGTTTVKPHTCVASGYMNKPLVVSTQIKSKMNIAQNTEPLNLSTKCANSREEPRKSTNQYSRPTRPQKRRFHQSVSSHNKINTNDKKINLGMIDNDNANQTLQTKESHSNQKIRAANERQISPMESRQTTENIFVPHYKTSISKKIEHPKQKICKVEKRNVLDYHLCSRCMLDRTVASLKPPKKKIKSQICLKCKKKLNPKDLMCKLCHQCFPNIMIYAGHAFNHSPSGEACDNFVCIKCRHKFHSRFSFHTHLAQSNCANLCFNCDKMFRRHENMIGHSCI